MKTRTNNTEGRRFRRIVFAFLIVVGLLVLGGIGSVVLWRLKLRREVNSRIAAIRAQGYPINWEELARWPCEVPDSENAALIYNDAIDHLRLDGVTAKHLYDFELPRRNEPPSEETRSNFLAALHTNEAALAIACSASNLSRSRYPIDYLEGPAAQLPHLPHLKQLVNLFGIEAFIKAEAGDMPGAAKAVEISLNVARSLDDEPILISQWTAGSLLIASCQNLEIVLTRGALPDETLTRLEQKLVSAEATNRFVMALIGERALNAELIRLAQDDVRRLVGIANQGSNDEEKTEMPARNPGFFWRLLGFFERDRNFYLRAMETNILIATVMPPASLSLTNEIGKLEALARRRFYILSSMLLPGSSHTAFRDAMTRAYLRVAITVVAIERWRSAHQGAIPDSLDQLVPSLLVSVPQDPFDGQRLRFKRSARGYIVYSIGGNLQDDGGRERPSQMATVPREERSKYDITFTVER